MLNAKEIVDNLSPYKLTIIAAIVVVVLSAGLVVIFDGPQNATPYLALVGSIAIPTLFNLFKLEQNSIVQQTQHEENSAKLESLKEELNK